MPTPVSLITTVYNRAPFLPACLDSILAQTYPHFHLLIWDDGSTDDSLEIAHHYAQKDDRIRVIAAPHQGLAPALQSAIAKTSGDYLGWVDSDDLLAPTALSETVAILDAQSPVGVVYTNHLIIDEQGQDKGLGRLCRIPYSKDRLLLEFMTFHFRLLRRSVYEQVGGIDPTFTSSEDYDLCLKLSEVTDFYHLPRPLYFYRRHSDNITNNQVEVIGSVHRAVTHALQRRGLDQHYHLKLSSTFSFQPKPTASEQPVAPLQNWEPVSLDPLVSIVIPVYNAAPRLRHCLQSCLDQTYPNLEIIVVDNNSTDGSREMVEQLAQTTSRSLTLLDCQPQGQNYSRNLGFAQAQGDFIQWLDADDELAPDKIARQVIALVQQPEFEIAYGDWDWHFSDARQPIAQLRFVDRAYEDFAFQLLIDNWRPPHTHLLRRRAALRLHQLQAWHPETIVCTDREYFTLATLLGFRFLHVPNSWVRYHHWSSCQQSRVASARDRAQSRRQMFRRFQDIAVLSQGGKLTPDQQFLLRQNWDFWQPSFTLGQSKPGTFFLQHTQHSELLPLTWQEAHMAQALLQAARPRTIEDHARKIIQLLWLSILAELTQTGKAALDFHDIADQLAWRIGCSDQTPVPEEEAAWYPVLDSQLPMVNATVLHPLLQEVPLFFPLLGAERFRVQQFLDRLRQGHWLQQVGIVSQSGATSVSSGSISSGSMKMLSA